MSVAGRSVAVLGGDRRMAAAAAELAARGAWVRVTHLPGDVAPPGTTRTSGPDEALTGSEVVLLPVQPVGEDGRIYTESPARPLYIRPAVLDRLAPGGVILVGVAPHFLREAARERGLRLVEYRDRDDFAVANSVPSAEGAIQMAMEASPLCLSGSEALVLGYGRTGMTLAHMLRGLGARVTVVARRRLERLRADALGHRAVDFGALPGAAERADFVFNTVPASVLTRDVLARMPGHAVIVDLASAPGGTDFAAAEELGLRAFLAPGLPGKVAPVTAGRIIADLVTADLAEEHPDPAGSPPQGAG